MKQKLRRWTILSFGVIVLLVFFLFMFFFFNRQKNTSGFKTFAEDSGFTFEYPVFNGWDIQTAKSNEQGMYLILVSSNKTLFEVQPTMRIVARKSTELSRSGTKTNKFDTQYKIDEKNGKITFVGDDFYTVDFSPWDYEQNGFSGKEFVKKVVNSFRFLNQSVGNPASYGDITTFALEKEITYPDFSITYMGKDSTKGPNNASWSMVSYNFIVTDSKNNMTKVSWSSGTGLLGPEFFTVDNKKFSLELRYFEKDKKWLKPDEMVISSVTQ